MLLEALDFVLKFWSQYFALVTLLHNYRPTAGISSVFQHSQNPLGDIYVHLVLAKYLSSSDFPYG